jgi:hypothetical protein
MEVPSTYKSDQELRGNVAALVDEFALSRLVDSPS